MGATKHTSYRLSDTTKARLKDLADLDGITVTAAITALVNAEYRERREEIKEYKEVSKNTENESKSVKK